MDQDTSWPPWRGRIPSGQRGTAAVVAALAAGALFLVAWVWAGTWRDARDREALRSEVTSSLAVHRAALASALANRLALVQGLRAFVEGKVARDEPVEAQYGDYAARLAGVVRGTRNLAVARGTAYILVYPQQGNESVLGYDLLADRRPEVVEETRRVLKGVGVVLGGPYELRQGGTGLVARQAVFDGDAYWGLVAAAVDLQPILEDAGLSVSEAGIETAVRKPGAKPFFGPASVFDDDPVEARIDLPDGYWVMGAHPKGGWARHDAESRRLWYLTGIVLTLVPTGLVFVLVWRQRLREDAQLEQRLSEMLENIRVVSVILDREGRITFCNSYLLRLSGWTREQVVGRNWFETFVPAPVRDQVRAEYQAAIAGGEGWHYENQLVTRGGALREIAWDSTLLRDARGGIVGAASFGRDVTEQRQLEVQYRQAQKMDAIGQLAGGIAHDFNNLLQVITGYTALALTDLPDAHPLHQELVEIRAAADRATALVRQLLAFSRQQKIERRAIDINETIANLLKMLRRLIGEHIELEFAPGNDVRPVSADPGLLEQVLMNLCVNARDAMPDGGRIDITTENVTLGREFVQQRAWGAAGEYVLTTVSDTGPGIPPDLQDRIFEPFFTTKEIGKGTGLGLATVYGIVKQHEGFVEAARDVAHGAAFRVYLPVASRIETRPATAPATPRPQPAGGTILLAEDEDLVRNLARRVLERAGYRVLIAKDGGEGIELAERHAQEIDLALLDVVMPKASGAEVSARLKALRPNVPVIFCSGYSRQMVDEGLLHEDGVELLLKPYEPRALLDRIHARLSAASL